MRVRASSSIGSRHTTAPLRASWIRLSRPCSADPSRVTTTVANAFDRTYEAEAPFGLAVRRSWVVMSEEEREVADGDITGEQQDCPPPDRKAVGPGGEGVLDLGG